MLLSVTVLSQGLNTKQIGDPKSYMTPEQLLQFEKDLQIANMEKKMEQYGKWVGVGGEVGQTINEGLMAVVDVSDKFGKTNIDKFTLIMVAWKVMGKDIVRIFLGIIFLIIITVVLFRIHKRSFSTRKIINKNPGFMKYPKKYEIIKPESDWEGYDFVKTVLYPFLYAGAIGLTYVIMFGGA